MKKVLLVGVSLIFILGSCSSRDNKQKEFNKDDFLVVIDSLKKVQNRKNKELTNRIDDTNENWSASTLINWSSYSVPYFKPDKIIQIRTIKELRELNNTNLKGLIIDIDFKDSLNYETITFNQLPELEYLEIRNTHQCPMDFKGLTNIKTLKFNYIYDLDSIPDLNVGLKNIEALLITGANDLTSLPEGIFNMTNLKSLSLSGLKMSRDTLSSDIMKLSELRHFDFQTCSMALPDEISELKKLQDLRIYNFSYYTPYAAIYKLPELKILELNMNKPEQFDGISNLTKLKILDLETYVLSPEIGSITSLEGLSIYGNISEGYPSSLGNLKEIYALQLTFNQQMQYAPEFILDLPKLNYLQIKGCDRLTEFDPAFKELKNLSLFDLSSNDSLTTIPNSLLHLEKIINLK